MTPLLLFLCSIVCSSSSQYWQKVAALQFEQHPTMVWRDKLTNKALLIAIVLLAISAVTWLGVLSQWPVSVAYPALSLNFVLMLGIARGMFHEPVYIKQLVGALLIVAGIIILTGEGL